jgi:hypothetical protein
VHDSTPSDWSGRTLLSILKEKAIEALGISVALIG